MIRIACAGVFALALALTASPVFAQNCAENFVVEGVPMLTAMNFRSSQVFANAEPARVVNRLNQALLAEGFSGIRIDRANGALTAAQETSGSGRPQTLRLVARKAGTGTRVDGVFMIQAGQVASADTVRAAMCRVIGAARG
jgi:hypothetical protein